MRAFDLQQALASIGMVQTEFAEVFRVQQSTVSRWLSGEVPVPYYVEAWLRQVHPEVFND